MFLEVRDSEFVFKVINLYVTYTNKQPLWNSMLDLGVLDEPNSVLGGDLIFTLLIREVWGSNPHKDPLEGIFQLFLNLLSSWMWLSPRLTPMWKDVEGILRWLDQFLSP